MVFGVHRTPSWAFTETEEARIRDGVAAGVSDRILANELGRTRRSIQSKRVAMGIILPVSLRKNNVPVIVIDWDPVEVDVVTLRDYAEVYKLAATPAAVNAFRRMHGLPEWIVNLRRWAA